jgi:hypothetical protein
MIATAGEVRQFTDKGCAFYTPSRTVWLPRALIVETESGVEMPQWLAQKLGLLPLPRLCATRCEKPRRSGGLACMELSYHDHQGGERRERAVSADPV